MKIDEQIIRTELITNQITQKDLAKKLNVKLASIIYWVKKYNLIQEIKDSKKQNQYTKIQNNTYGYLTVNSFHGTDAWGKSEWNCTCICGNKVVVGATRLVLGITKSCGCYRKSTNKSKLWRGVGELSKDYFSSIKRSALSRNLEFNITIEYCWNLFLNQNKNCALSGVELSLYHHKRNKIRRTASLDRIDNNRGYVEGNVQWVHKHINIAKHTYSNKEFIEICNKVAKLHPIFI